MVSGSAKIRYRLRISRMSDSVREILQILFMAVVFVVYGSLLHSTNPAEFTAPCVGAAQCASMAAR